MDSKTVKNSNAKNLGKSVFSVRGGGQMTGRTLLAALLIGAAPALADDLSTPTLGDDSAYTLTKVDAAGDNTITKFEYNSSTGEFTPVYYRVDLKQTEYGSKTGDTSLTYGWQENQDTGTELVENPSSSIGQEITYKYDSTAGDTYTNKTDSAISNSTNRDAITGNFIKNEADRYRVGGGEKGGGAGVYNTGNINYQESNLQDAIIGDFIGNTTTGGGYRGNIYVYGGAIYNKGQIGNIVGNYINNSVYNDCSGYANRIEVKYSDGGAIYNSGTIGNITGNFIGNKALSTDVDYSRGGAISNNGGTIGNITGNFISNIAYSDCEYDKHAYGGAIHNTGTIGDITGDFIDNRAFTTRGGTAGGAIYNNGRIGNLKGDFIGNNLTHADVQLRNFLQTMRGGAIYNRNTLGNIDGDFINNGINALNSDARGGAIYNQAKMGDINGSFYNNYVISEMYDAGGGAIANEDTSTIKSINGDFVNNNLTANWDAFGGAIHNLGEIDIITGNFVNNSLKSNGTNNFAYGGAISNGYPNGVSSYPTGARKINTVNADFIGNHVTGYYAYGGAISNYATIGTINGDFTGNYVIGESAARGGAIYRSGLGPTSEIAKDSIITGNFTNNYTKGNSTSSGGAIYNTWDLASLTGNFTNNHADAVSKDANGGAIYNTHTITLIDGNYTGNYAISEAASADGGAIYNDSGTIGTLTGIFQENYAKADGNTDDVHAYGGAIYNTGTITDIQADFNGNYTHTISRESFGGAIYNAGTIENITGNFNGNYARLENTGSNEIMTLGGAIYNTGKIGIITGDFTGNYVQSDKRQAYGGAIYNASGAEISEINGNFIENKALGYTGSNGSLGSAIYNNGSIGNITGNFYKNETYSNVGGYTGATVWNTGSINTLTGDFIENFSHTDGKISDAGGGALLNAGTIDVLNSNFRDNCLAESGTAADGGASYGAAIRMDAGSIGTINGDFTGNHIDANGIGYGGAITMYGGEIDTINGDFINNYATANTGYAYAGAIINTGTIKNIYGDFIGNYAESKEDIAYGGAILTQTVMENISGSFINNHVTSEKSTALGGAILAQADITINADNRQNVFSGNYTLSQGVKDDNAIYMSGDDLTLSFNMKNGGSVVMEDNIDGTGTYNVDIAGDDKDSTTFFMLNDIRNSNLTAGNTTLNTINDIAHVYNFNSFALTGNTNFVADVDLAAKEMDRFTAGSYGEHQGNLNVIGMNLLSDANMDEDVTAVYFAEPGLKNNVVNGTGELPDSYQTAYTPIYKYNVTYDNENEYDGKGDGGYFLFTRGDKIIYPDGDGGSTGNDSDAFNPAVLATPVGNLAAGQAAVNEAFKYVFEHADAFTQLPAMERYAKINANKYALSTDVQTLYNF